ncbi:uncharacterized protein LOC113792807 [Dermatophagoides pteronyssinus]|uniref:uncharacterized protein LOC113792807 n=1 Tax=Dermatophagoides pteronyssinus TaxID=6956 RepID=UPI003F66C4BB
MFNIHQSNVVIFLLLLVLSSFYKNGFTQSSLNLNETSSTNQFRLSTPTPTPILSQPLLKSNAIEYFQWLLQKALPLNLNHEQTKIFLIAPANYSGTNNSNLSSSQQQQQQTSTNIENDNIIFTGISQPIERRKSYYFLIPNEQLNGRSASEQLITEPQIVSDPIATQNYSSEIFDNSLSQNFTNFNQSNNFSLLTEESRTSGNDSHSISNPFASSPYRSSNDVIESLIKNIFSDLTLQSLPPEDVLFGKLPERDSKVDLDPAIIFGNITQSDQRSSIELNQSPPQNELASQFQSQPSPQLQPQFESQFQSQPSPQLQPQFESQFQAQPLPQLQPPPAPKFQDQPLPQLQPPPAPQFQDQPLPQLQPPPASKFQDQPLPQLQPPPAPKFQDQPLPQLQPPPAPQFQDQPLPQLQPRPLKQFQLKPTPQLEPPSPPPTSSLQLQTVNFRQPPTTPLFTNYSLENFNNQILRNDFNLNQSRFINNNNIDQGLTRDLAPNHGNYSFDRENFTFVRNDNNLPSSRQHSGFANNFTINQNYNLTNSNNYQPPTTVPLNLSSFRFSKIPPPYQAGVEYSAPDEMPDQDITDQDLFVELNRIQEQPSSSAASSSAAKPAPVSRFSTTNVPQTFPTSFNNEIVATTLPINYGQQQNQPQQNQPRMVGEIPTKTFFPPTPIPRGQTVQFHSQRVTHVAPSTKSTSNLSYQNLNTSRYNNFFNNNFYAPYDNTNYSIYNSPIVSGSNDNYYKYNFSGNNFVETFPNKLQTTNQSPLLPPPPTSTLVTNSLPNKQQLSSRHSTGLLLTSTFTGSSSISQRSKLRPTPININNIPRPQPPPTLRTNDDNIPMVMIPSDMANRLVNIISLPNYKFYLGKKIR